MYRQVTHGGSAYQQHRASVMARSLATHPRSSTRKVLGSALMSLGERHADPNIVSNTYVSRPV